MSNDNDDAGLEAVLLLLKSGHGFDFTGYKRSSLARRIRRRMSAVAIEDFASYAAHLAADPEECEVLFNSILINVTSFFRDPEAWTCIAEEIIPRILANAASKSQVRVWCAGCATGEEPYSIAMLLAQAMGPADYARRAKVYATDWDADALAIARRARYTTDQLEPIPEPLRAAYFTARDGVVELDGGLRRSVIFGRHDLTEDPPISRLDLLLCRNTLMYLTAETQARVLGRLHFALDARGYLFLGRAEMMLSHVRFFTPFELRHRVFTKVPGQHALLAGSSEAEMPRETNNLSRFNDVALDAGPVAQLILDADDRVATLNQRVRRMFQLGPAEIGRRLQDLELSYRPADLRTLLDRARQQRAPATLTAGRQLVNGETQHLDITVTPLLVGDDHIATSITFDDVTPHHVLQEHLQQFSHNLETAYEELQSANEELETTNEELQSSNEELETTNEELQATNEEMETVNEELRSTNEELHVANEQLRARERELDTTNVFLQAILGSLQAGVAVVDAELRVQVWNQQAEDLWGVRANEVRGKSFVVLDIGLPVASLATALHEAIRSGVSTRVEIDAINRRGRPIRCRVSICPLQESRPVAATVLMDVLTDEAASA